MYGVGRYGNLCTCTATVFYLQFGEFDLLSPSMCTYVTIECTVPYTEYVKLLLHIKRECLIRLVWPERRTYLWINLYEDLALDGQEM